MDLLVVVVDEGSMALAESYCGYSKKTKIMQHMHGKFP